VLELWIVAEGGMAILRGRRQPALERAR
jgi:hypothetical protein